ncbi:LPS translocon maturation chaperone LptM [Ottowia sp.]|uniref:LPS translocon maturation chaperone LptM n=1 Tax=Ottowia sp. TaxID=1898956 RepID=UPI0039E52088
MSFQPVHRIILATGLALAGAAILSACGQKGPLTIPDTPAAQQRATLPQTVFGGARAPAPPASAASAPPRPVPVPALPNVPDIQ